MQTTIGAFDAATKSVPVTFVHDAPSGETITHDRAVNACLDESGSYDAEATTARVEEVARGVAVKIAVGAITNPPPPPDGTDAD
jgi:hypothetical protein